MILQFPDFVGAAPEHKHVARFKTAVFKSITGSEVRTGYYTEPIYEATIPINYLSDKDFTTLTNFIYTCKGSLYSFLYKVPPAIAKQPYRVFVQGSSSYNDIPSVSGSIVAPASTITTLSDCTLARFNSNTSQVYYALQTIPDNKKFNQSTTSPVLYPINIDWVGVVTNAAVQYFSGADVVTPQYEAKTYNGEAISAWYGKTRLRADVCAAYTTSSTIIWSGSYAYRCRFDDDGIGIDHIFEQAWETKNIKLIGSPSGRIS